jgi:hypothetical protein
MNGEVLGLERAGDALSDCLCFVRLVGYSPGFNDIPFLNFKNVSGHVVME